MAVLRRSSVWLVRSAVAGLLVGNLAPLQAGGPSADAGQPLPPTTRPREVTRCGVGGHGA
jgi:hypothetical protein